MQDDTSNPGVPFACGLTLEKLSAHTVDEGGNEAFVKDNPLSLLRKVISSYRQLHLMPAVCYHKVEHAAAPEVEAVASLAYCCWPFIHWREFLIHMS